LDDISKKINIVISSLEEITQCLSTNTNSKQSVLKLKKFMAENIKKDLNASINKNTNFENSFVEEKLSDDEEEDVVTDLTFTS
jgi:hypothetical protein